MGEWISKNGEIVVGSVIGIAGIIVALLIYFWQRNPKRLDYLFMYHAPVLSGRAHSLDIKVMHDEQEIANPYLMTVRIKNTGKLPVRDDEYQHDGIVIAYEGGVAPLDVSVPKESSPDLVGPMLMAPREGFIAVAPELLNAKDWFDLQILSDGEPDGVKVHSRFVGQSRPMRDLDPTPVNAFRLMLAGIAVVVIAFVASLVLQTESVANVGLVLGFVMVMAGMAGVGYRILRTPFDKNEGMPGGF